MTVCGQALNIDHDTTSRLSDELQGESGAPLRAKPILGTCHEGELAKLLISKFLEL